MVHGRGVGGCYESCNPHENDRGMTKQNKRDMLATHILSPTEKINPM